MRSYRVKEAYPVEIKKKIAENSMKYKKKT
jgi:hypothetical protein